MHFFIVCSERYIGNHAFPRRSRFLFVLTIHWFPAWARLIAPADVLGNTRRGHLNIHIYVDSWLWTLWFEGISGKLQRSSRHPFRLLFTTLCSISSTRSLSTSSCVIAFGTVRSAMKCTQSSATSLSVKCMGSGRWLKHSAGMLFPGAGVLFPGSGLICRSYVCKRSNYFFSLADNFELGLFQNASNN